ncbi:hypothetical protein SAMN04488564_103750 [Lentzea waywayandensis]|uniref:Uncharacterized protein n=1 Tax=Lentzea waywayandensis TaxID=84724 RepID=A0A1I6E380_9PSEU|nr:hypothetical protein [Lentzea waywayandensis]SFR12173.1 hypothetical protein SAMN04488564_103750 [Lentzea waywayandensis]
MTDGQIKSVDIQIAQADLKTLKDSGYKLCFAKKVNGTYNVVWQSAEKYLHDNTFSWQPLYQLFGSNTFQGNVNVKVATNEVAVGLGDQATLDKDGNLGEASTGGPATGITMINQFGPIHPGLSAYSTDINGNGSTTPIYVGESPIVLGNDLLTPVEAVQVWFEQDVATGTMFSVARSNAVDIDLTSGNSAVRLYSDGKWSTPKSQALYADPATILTIIAGLTAAVIVHDLATKIASKLSGVYKDIQVSVTAADGQSVKIVYSEKPRLTGTRQTQTQLLLLNPATIDQLSEFALEAFAQLGVGYRTLNAMPGR